MMYFLILSTQIYEDIAAMYCILVCGNMNARIGNLSDYIVNVDTGIPVRNVIDDVKNSQGNEFIDFLQEMSTCVCVF